MFFLVFFEDWDFFQNWEKSHLNFIENGAEFRPLRTHEQIPVIVLIFLTLVACKISLDKQCRPGSDTCSF